MRKCKVKSITKGINRKASHLIYFLNSIVSDLLTPNNYKKVNIHNGRSVVSIVIMVERTVDVWDQGENVRNKYQSLKKREIFDL